MQNGVKWHKTEQKQFRTEELALEKIGNTNKWARNEKDLPKLECKMTQNNANIESKQRNMQGQHI